MCIFEDAQDLSRYTYGVYNRKEYKNLAIEQPYEQDQVVFQLAPQYQIWNKDILDYQNIYDPNECATNYFFHVRLAPSIRRNKTRRW